MNPRHTVIYITDRADEIIWKRGLQNWRRSECEAQGPEPPPGRGPPSSGGGCDPRGRRRRLHTDAGNQTDLNKPLPRLDAAPRRAGRAPSLPAPLDIWGASVVWAASNALRARVPRLTARARPAE